MTGSMDIIELSANEKPGEFPEGRDSPRPSPLSTPLPGKGRAQRVIGSGSTPTIGKGRGVMLRHMLKAGGSAVSSPRTDRVTSSEGQGQISDQSGAEYVGGGFGDLTDNDDDAGSVKLDQVGPEESSGAG